FAPIFLVRPSHRLLRIRFLRASHVFAHGFEFPRLAAALILLRILSRYSHLSLASRLWLEARRPNVVRVLLLHLVPELLPVLNALPAVLHLRFFDFRLDLFRRDLLLRFLDRWRHDGQLIAVHAVKVSAFAALAKVARCLALESEALDRAG